MNNVVIIKEKRKTISIKVNNDLSIVVKCPINVSNERAMVFVNKKHDWINKKIKEFSLKNAKYATILNKNQSLILGKFVPYVKNSVYNRLAVDYLTQKTQELSKILNLKYNLLSFKHYKSRWGCCDAKKNIVLNYKLYMLDEYTIKCVIVHELLHTLYLNHGKTFKKSLENIIGNTSIYKERLKEVGFLLKI